MPLGAYWVKPRRHARFSACGLVRLSHLIKLQRIAPEYRCLILIAEPFVFFQFLDRGGYLGANFVGEVAGEQEVVVAGSLKLIVEVDLDAY